MEAESTNELETLEINVLGLEDTAITNVEAHSTWPSRTEGGGWYAICIRMRRQKTGSEDYLQDSYELWRTSISISNIPRVECKSVFTTTSTGPEFHLNDHVFHSCFYINHLLYPWRCVNEASLLTVVCSLNPCPSHKPTTPELTRRPRDAIQTEPHVCA